MATVTLRPTADNSIGGWKNSDDTTTDLYSYVDEVTLSELDYVYTRLSESTIPDDYIDFTFGSSGIATNSTINKITIHMAGNSFSGSRTAYGDDYGIYVYLTSTRYTYLYTMDDNYEADVELLKNPYTDEAWTVSEINNLIAGLSQFELSSKEQGHYLYQYYIVVDYTEPITLDLKVNVGGSLKSMVSGSVRVDGVLKAIDSMWVRIGGVLKKV